MNPLAQDGPMIAEVFLRSFTARIDDKPPTTGIIIRHVGADGLTIARSITTAKELAALGRQCLAFAAAAEAAADNVVPIPVLSHVEGGRDLRAHAVLMPQLFEAKAGTTSGPRPNGRAAAPMGGDGA